MDGFGDDPLTRKRIVRSGFSLAWLETLLCIVLFAALIALIDLLSLKAALERDALSGIIKEYALAPAQDDADSISSYISDQIPDDIRKQYGLTEAKINEILHDERVTDAVNEYADRIADFIVDGKLDDAEISRLVDKIGEKAEVIKEKTGYEIQKEDIDIIREELQENGIGEVIEKNIPPEYTEKLEQVRSFAEGRAAAAAAACVAVIFISLAVMGICLKRNRMYGACVTTALSGCLGLAEAFALEKIFPDRIASAAGAEEWTGLVREVCSALADRIYSRSMFCIAAGILMLAVAAGVSALLTSALKKRGYIICEPEDVDLFGNTSAGTDPEDDEPGRGVLLIVTALAVLAVTSAVIMVLIFK